MDHKEIYPQMAPGVSRWFISYSSLSISLSPVLISRSLSLLFFVSLSSLLISVSLSLSLSFSLLFWSFRLSYFLSLWFYHLSFSFCAIFASSFSWLHTIIPSFSHSFALTFFFLSLGLSIFHLLLLHHILIVFAKEMFFWQDPLVNCQFLIEHIKWNEYSNSKFNLFVFLLYLSYIWWPQGSVAQLNMLLILNFSLS